MSVDSKNQNKKQNNNKTTKHISNLERINNIKDKD